MPRKFLPARRQSWTRKVHIESQGFYLCFGEYEDGTLGEVFLDSHKEGTFARGILQALGRITSIALQCGAEPADIVKAFQGLNFPPHGEVQGSSDVTVASSICDWLAQEIRASYVPEYPTTLEGDAQVAGYTSSLAQGLTVTLTDPAEEDHFAALTGTGDSVVEVLTTATLVEATTTLLQAKKSGYTGDLCPQCGSIRMTRNGACLLCTDCGATSGCS